MSPVPWLADNWIEIFGAIAGVVYVFLEIRQNLWLWPVGIITSTVYIWVFFNGRLYADMSLHVYYLIISILGWYWWIRGSGEVKTGQDIEKEDIKLAGDEGGKKLVVSRISVRQSMVLCSGFALLFILMYQILVRLTDSPVPAADAFLTSLSVIATWMLARKIYEHWYLWILINAASSVFFLYRGLYPTVILYLVYCTMSFAGLKAWKKSL